MKDRLAFEKQSVTEMIGMFCRGRHRSKELCPDCSRLLTYAKRRIDRCRYGGRKPVCSKCSTHCYNVGMQQQIRAVMRFSGPRMLIRHPLMALRHLAQFLRLR